MRRFCNVLPALLIAACGPADQGTSVTIPADTLYVNATVWTGEEGQADASMLAVRDVTVVYVGDGQGFSVDAGETVDLEGRFVMPGFIDNHVHWLDGGAALASVVLRDASSPEEFTRRISEFAAAQPPGRWILQGNWDHELWGGTLPHRHWIDDVTGENPVFVYRLDGHMALANTAALELAGLDRMTPTPDGGEIIRDADGELTGILKDNAMNLVAEVIPPPAEEELLAMFEAAQSHALSLGLTQVHSMTADFNEAQVLDTLRLARDSGLMKIRIYEFSPLDRWIDARDLVASDATGDDMLRWGGLKGFVDGSLGSTTAWFHEPYLDAPRTSGFPLSDPEDLASLVRDADEARLRLAVHAIGDKAIDELIRSFRRTAGDDIRERRYRIEHFQHPTLPAIEAAAESGIIASVQPYHAIDDGRWAEKRIGPERIKTTYAFRTMLDKGVIMTFGSDWPVAPLSPLQGVYAAVTRRTTDGANPEGWQPQEKITVEEALTAYTATNAYAGFEEGYAGSLHTGSRADFVVLSEDPRAVDPITIPDIEVVATIVGGEIVFGAVD